MGNIKLIPYLVIQLSQFWGKWCFKLFFKWVDWCLMFGHLIRFEGWDGRGLEVLNTILLSKILMNLSTILSNSLSKILVIPNGLVVGLKTLAISQLCPMEGTFCPVHSKAIKETANILQRIHLECYFVKHLLGIHSIFHFELLHLVL